MHDWQSILAEHGPTVWRTVYRLLHHHADALDCYQETFLGAWQFAQQRHVDDWPAFLVCLGTRRALNRLRNRRRTQDRLQPIQSAPEPATEAESPVGQASANELLERVRRGMAELPDKQGEVFWLNCIEGLSHQQISDRMNVPPGGVRVLLHRARERLRAVLDPEQLGEKETR
jgi:RNA polymerase sigma-70 factor (ECF subfamily)